MNKAEWVWLMCAEGMAERMWVCGCLVWWTDLAELPLDVGVLEAHLLGRVVRQHLDRTLVHLARLDHAVQRLHLHTQSFEKKV
jgi:hypothetical protein